MTPDSSAPVKSSNKEPQNYPRKNGKSHCYSCGKIFPGRFYESEQGTNQSSRTDLAIGKKKITLKSGKIRKSDKY